MKALVTGGTKGIGLAIANKLASQGHEVTICSRKYVDTPGLKWNPCDILNPESIGEFMDNLGPIDILALSAGGGGTWGSNDILKTSQTTWFEVWQKNAGAAAQFVMQALPGMLIGGWGRVVAITSLHGLERGGRPWFNVAKAAEGMLMENLAQRPELVRSGITFNSVAPGRIAVGKESDVTPEYLESLPLGRLGTPEEVAEVVAFLCSPAASLVNGSHIRCGEV